MAMPRQGRKLLCVRFREQIMSNTITKQKLEKYFEVSEKALSAAEKSAEEKKAA